MSAFCLLASFHKENLLAGWFSPLALIERHMIVIGGVKYVVKLCSRATYCGLQIWMIVLPFVEEDHLWQVLFHRGDEVGLF